MVSVGDVGQLLYPVAGLLSLGLAVVLWRQRDAVGAVPLAVMNLALGVRMASLGLVGFAPPAVGIWSLRLSLPVLGVFFAAFFLFALTYTGREEYITRRVLGALAIHPVIFLGLAVFNPASVLFVDLQPVAGFTDQVVGPAFWIHAVYGFALGIASMLMVLWFLVRSRHSVFRGQAVLILVGMTAPLVLTPLYLSGAVAINLGAISWVVMSGLLTVAVGRYQLADLTPIVRETVIDNMRDGMVVLDTDHRIVDFNEPATQLLAFADEPIGEPLSEGILTSAAVTEELSGLLADGADRSGTIQVDGRFLTVEATPLVNARDRRVGWTLLLQNVTERVQRERDLERANERLREFASLVSHDLRNPLTVAQGRAELLAEERPGEHTERITAALQRMETMIDETLELARAGEAIESVEPCHLGSLVERAWDTTGDESATLESRLTNETVAADPNRLLRVFENLFRNALEHNEGSVTVRVGPLEDREGFYVADTGTGIPSADRDAVFDHGFTTSADGGGLGLAMVQDVVEAHGWTVGVTESAEGGARFEIATA